MITILNVDDQEPARYAKSRTLKHAGFGVHEAANGYEALRLAEQLQPAVILLDVQLPDISGLEVCSLVKERWPHIMVLQTSATYTTGEDRTRGLESGADSYLTQPIEPRELVAAVRSLLRLREAEEDLRRLNETLEQKILERTHDLAAANQRLKDEIEQRKRAEAALLQSQKMEAIGHLTGGIAHDFNNLLTAVVGNLDRIRARASDPKLRRWAENAFMAAERGTKLTAQLLAFSRTQQLLMETVDIVALVHGMLELMRQSLGPAVELNIQLPGGLPRVLADGNQLELALLNLVINARDAMPHGGSITLTAAVVRIEVGVDDGLPVGEYVDVTVTDTGVGMTPAVAAQAFDPFFTTKPAGKGTGLGLSQVYGIARQSGGAARIVSELGRGTSVSIRLRATSGEAVQPANEGEPAQLRNTEVILVVDDDPDVWHLVEDFLSDIGYRTYVAANGEEALNMLETVRPDAVLLDFAMPGQNGAEVSREIRMRLPHLPIMFFSGYANIEALDQAVGDAPILRKPFRPRELAAALRGMLDPRE